MSVTQLQWEESTYQLSWILQPLDMLRSIQRGSKVYDIVRGFQGGQRGWGVSRTHKWQKAGESKLWKNKWTGKYIVEKLSIAYCGVLMATQGCNPDRIQQPYKK